MTTLEYGPLQEQTMITAGLDYYKPTMSQLAYEQEPDAVVTFTFKNRGEQRIADYVDIEQLQQRFDDIQAHGFGRTELQYLAGLKNSQGDWMFGEDYLDSIDDNLLPRVNVTVEDDDIAIRTSGEWSMVTFWETVVMSELNELYFENYVGAHGVDIMSLYDEGERRLQAKIDVLKTNPDIKIADFGTRRHFSLRWQNYVLERLLDECPGNILGTSNVALARKHNIKPIGTFAHEMPMVYAGLADARGQDIRASHNQMLRDWYDCYGNDLSTALTDTFTADFFFEDLTPEQAKAWRGLRHDSGDPYEFGEKAIAFYEANNIDPTAKTIVFSDGLDIQDIVALHAYFKDRVNVVFGWGTTLTNDLGIKPLNIVMKATEVNGTKTVKLSDNPGKHTGPEEKVAEYQQIFNTQEKTQNNQPTLLTL